MTGTNKLIAAGMRISHDELTSHFGFKQLGTQVNGRVLVYGLHYDGEDLRVLIDSLNQERDGEIVLGIYYFGDNDAGRYSHMDTMIRIRKEVSAT